jgi:hypothetical protein
MLGVAIAMNLTMAIRRLQTEVIVVDSNTPAPVFQGKPIARAPRFPFAARGRGKMIVFDTSP